MSEYKDTHTMVDGLGFQTTDFNLPTNQTDTKRIAPEIEELKLAYPDAFIDSKDSQNDGNILILRDIYNFLSAPQINGISSEDIQVINNKLDEATDYDNTRNFSLVQGLKEARNSFVPGAIRFVGSNLCHTNGLSSDVTILDWKKKLGANDQKKIILLLEVTQMVGEYINEKRPAHKVAKIQPENITPLTIIPIPNKAELQTNTLEINSPSQNQPPFFNPIEVNNAPPVQEITIQTPDQLSTDQIQRNLEYIEKLEARYTQAFDKDGEILKLRAVQPFLKEKQPHGIIQEVFDTIQARMRSVTNLFPYDRNNYVPADNESFLRDCLTPAIYEATESGYITFSKMGLQYPAKDGHSITIPIEKIGPHDMVRLSELLELTQLIHVQEERLGIRR